MADDSNPQMFLIFFLTLAGCSLLSLPVTWCVRDKSREQSEDCNVNTNKGFVSAETMHREDTEESYDLPAAPTKSTKSTNLQESTAIRDDMSNSVMYIQGL